MYSEYVFKGTVVQKVEYKDEYNFEFYRYTIEIGEFIKGNMSDTFILNTFKGGAACGLNLKVGTEYYLFASEEKFADSCGQSVEATKVKRKFKKVIKNYKKNKNKKIWKDINGKLSSIGNLINGIPEGIWIYYNLDGSIEKVGEYLRGRRNGAWKFYYNNNKNSIMLNSKLNFLSDAIKLERRLSRTEYYKNGNCIWRTSN